MAVHPTRANTFSHYLSSSSDKIIEPPETQKASQSIFSCLYQTSIAAFWRNVTIIWSKNLMNYSINIAVDGNVTDNHYSCKIDLKPWHFWSKKGFKSFDVEGAEIEVFWDLRSAKFSTSPEPLSDYYVALVSDGEVVLLLGDMKKKVFKRTKSRPALIEAVLCQKTEHVFSKKTYSTKAVLDQKQQKVYDIIVESSSTLCHKDPEMWISIDGVVLIHVKNLQWKFRGNQTVIVNKQSIQVFWEVHDWLFLSPAGHGMFIFKPVDVESENDDVESDSNYYSSIGFNGKTSSEYCIFLYAWKIE